MLFIRSLILNIWTYLSIPIFGIFGLPFALYSRNGAYGVMRAYSHALLWVLRVVCGTKIEVRGTPPSGEVVLGAKHQSYIDMVIIMTALPRPRYIFKKELLYAPVFGFYAWRIGAIAVSRGKKGAAVRSMVTGIRKEQQTGKGQTVIFPQGTRVTPGVKAPYKIGVWKIADDLHVPTVPAATNAGLFWGRKTFLRYPGTIILEFLDPIAPGLEAKPYMEALELSIETASDCLNVEAGFPTGRI